MRVDVTISCYAWHQFTVTGNHVVKKYPHQNEWTLPVGMAEWFAIMIKGHYAIMEPSSSIPVFIQDAKDAMLFKLTWDGVL